MEKSSQALNQELLDRRRHSKWMKRIGRVVLGLGLIMMIGQGSLDMANLSQAATAVGGHGPGKYVSWPRYKNMWAGVYKLKGGGLAICVDPMLGSPSGTNSSDPIEVKSWKTGKGQSLSKSDLAAAAYITYWLPTSPTNTQAAAAKLALLAILQPTAWANFDPFTKGSDGYQAANNLGILTQVRDLVTEARSRATTWDGTAPSIVTNFDQISQPGDLITASMQLAGVPAGYEMVFTVTTPGGVTQRITATTDASGKSSISYPTASDVVGSYTVQFSIANLPPRYPMVINPANSSLQRMFVAVSKPRQASDVAGNQVVVQFNPEVRTRVSQAQLTAGDVLTDTVELTQLSQALSWKLTGRIRGPVEAIEGGCEGIDWTYAPDAIPPFSYLITADEITADGSATIVGLGHWEVPLNFLAFQEQCVSYQETLEGMNSSGQVVAQVDHPVGSPTQTAMVVQLPLEDEIEVDIPVDDAEIDTSIPVKDQIPPAPVVAAGGVVELRWPLAGVALVMTGLLLVVPCSHLVPRRR